MSIRVRIRPHCILNRTTANFRRTFIWWRALWLCFTDTDRFVCHIQSEDIVGELGAIADSCLDTLNFDRVHPLYSNTNFCSLVQLKSETIDVTPTEFCGLHSKMYSLATLIGDREYHKAKGVPIAYMEKHVTTKSTCASSVTGPGRCAGLVCFIRENTESLCTS